MKLHNATEKTIWRQAYIAAIATQQAPLQTADDMVLHYRDRTNHEKLGFTPQSSDPRLVEAINNLRKELSEKFPDEKDFHYTTTELLSLLPKEVVNPYSPTTLAKKIKYLSFNNEIEGVCPRVRKGRRGFVFDAETTPDQDLPDASHELSSNRKINI